MIKGTVKKFVYIFIAAAVVVVLFSTSNIRKILNLRRRIYSCENRLQILKEENKRLSREIKWIETEEGHIEYLARRNFALIKSGEIKFHIAEYRERKGN